MKDSVEFMSQILKNWYNRYNKWNIKEELYEIDET